jgi:hypothetical protein
MIRGTVNERKLMCLFGMICLLLETFIQERDVIGDIHNEEFLEIHKSPVAFICISRNDVVRR